MGLELFENAREAVAYAADKLQGAVDSLADSSMGALDGLEERYSAVVGRLSVIKRQFSMAADNFRRQVPGQIRDTLGPFLDGATEKLLGRRQDFPAGA